MYILFDTAEEVKMKLGPNRQENDIYVAAQKYGIIRVEQNEGR